MLVGGGGGGDARPPFDVGDSLPPSLRPFLFPPGENTDADKNLGIGRKEGRNEGRKGGERVNGKQASSDSSDGRRAASASLRKKKKGIK